MWKFNFIITLLLLNFVKSAEIDNDELREKESTDFEQCAPVNFMVGQLGVVNVVAFLDDTWAYSHKQAAMLKDLKDGLERSSLPEALFFVILSQGSRYQMEPITEEEMEKNAWEGVAPDEAMEFSSGLFPTESLAKTVSPDIFFIQDTEKLGIWRELGGSRDQILVIDRCGRLAYQVIVPWSILHFPYVKAAILSTHKDDPCGICDAWATVVELNGTDDSNGEDSLETTDLVDMETSTQHPNFLDRNNDEETVPSLRIIMHAPHYDLNTDTNSHEYLVLEMDKPDYHGHLDAPWYHAARSNGDRKIEKTLLSSITFGHDESPGLYGEVADYWRDGSSEQNEQVVPSGESADVEQGEVSTTGQDNLIDEAVTNYADSSVEDEDESKNRLIAHYSKLLPWIYFILKNE